MSNLRFIADNGVILPKHFLWNDAISEFCQTENFAFLADRFGYLNKFSRIRAAAISENMFPKGNSIQSFNDIMIERASYFAELCLKENKLCYVLWSGGCDSTAVVSAFLASNKDLSFLRVIYTNSSIIEYKEFYNFLIQNNIKMELVYASDIFLKAYTYAFEGNVVLTGFPADQLFGSIIGQSYPKDTTKTHWTEYLNKDIANQQYEAAFKHYGIPVKTIAEFLWFNNFALKWDYVCYPALWMSNIHHKNIIPFYNTKDFEDWSVSNYDILHKYDQKDYKKYKIQIKDFIYSITKLNSVYNLKKQPSLERAYTIDKVTSDTHINIISALDDENNIITSQYIGTKDIHKDGYCCVNIMRRYLK